jgi:hypothetical protein
MENKSLIKVQEDFLIRFHRESYIFFAVIQLLCGMQLRKAQVTVTNRLYIHKQVKSKLK